MRNRSASGRYIDWAGIIKRLRKTPGLWSLELTDTSARTAASVRLRRHPDLRVDDGRLEAMIVTPYRDENGQLRGNLHLRFVPATLARVHDTPNQGEEER